MRLLGIVWYIKPLLFVLQSFVHFYMKNIKYKYIYIPNTIYISELLMDDMDHLFIFIKCFLFLIFVHV